MGDKSESDLNALRSMVGLPEEKSAEPTPFAKSVAEALTKALAAMRESGMIEVVDSQKNIDRVMQHVNQIVREGLITMEKVRVIRDAPDDGSGNPGGRSPRFDG